MEIGEFRVYFIQYQSKAGHWITSNRAFSTLRQAELGYSDEKLAEYDELRIVEQTTCNRVV